MGDNGLSNLQPLTDIVRVQIIINEDYGFFHYDKSKNWAHIIYVEISINNPLIYTYNIHKSSVQIFNQLNFFKDICLF